MTDPDRITLTISKTNPGKATLEVSAWFPTAGALELVKLVAELLVKEQEAPSNEQP